MLGRASKRSCVGSLREVVSVKFFAALRAEYFVAIDGGSTVVAMKGLWGLGVFFFLCIHDGLLIDYLFANVQDLAPLLDIDAFDGTCGACAREGVGGLIVIVYIEVQ